MRRMLLCGLSLLALAGCAGAPASGWRAAEVAYPIDDLDGQYTVAAFHYWDVVEKDGSVSARAVTPASSMAYYLRHQHDLEAYVADLGGEAIVAVGTYDSWEVAQGWAEALAEVKEGLRKETQVPVDGAAGVGRSSAWWWLRPCVMDLTQLKERSLRLRHLHP